MIELTLVLLDLRLCFMNYNCVLEVMIVFSMMTQIVIVCRVAMLSYIIYQHKLLCNRPSSYLYLDILCVIFRVRKIRESREGRYFVLGRYCFQIPRLIHKRHVIVPMEPLLSPLS